jgi:hypothetical protein
MALCGESSKKELRSSERLHVRKKVCCRSLGARDVLVERVAFGLNLARSERAAQRSNTALF